MSLNPVGFTRWKKYKTMNACFIITFAEIYTFVGGYIRTITFVDISRTRTVVVYCFRYNASAADGRCPELVAAIMHYFILIIIIWNIVFPRSGLDGWNTKKSVSDEELKERDLDLILKKLLILSLVELLGKYDDVTKELLHNTLP